MGKTGPKPLPLSERFWKMVDKREIDECWEWTGHKLKGGYGSIFIQRRNPSKGIHRNGELAHRVSYKLHYEVDLADLHVLHKCDNRGCVNPHHLFLGTAKDNIHDCIAKGRTNYTGAKGEKNRSATLTAQQVLQIRELASTHTLAQLAKMFNVGESAISHIKARRSWKHIP